MTPGHHFCLHRRDSSHIFVWMPDLPLMPSSETTDQRRTEGLTFAVCGGWGLLKMSHRITQKIHTSFLICLWVTWGCQKVRDTVVMSVPSSSCPCRHRSTSSTSSPPQSPGAEGNIEDSPWSFRIEPCKQVTLVVSHQMERKTSRIFNYGSFSEYSFLSMDSGLCRREQGKNLKGTPLSQW